MLYILWNLLLFQPHMCFRNPCGAGRNQLHINVDGNIYPCQDWRSINEHPITNVINNDLAIKLKENELVRNIQNRNLDLIKECKKCNWKRFCGMCPREIFSEKGNINSNGSMCKFYDIVFREILWLFKDNLHNIEEYLC